MTYNEADVKVKKSLGKKKCKCGRRVVVQRTKEGRMPLETPECSTCKTYGLEESKRLFIENFVKTKSKSDKTQFKINEGRLPDHSDWKKK